MNRTALLIATAIGLALQLIMVVAGHFNGAIAGMFAIVGMLISLVAGVIYARRAQDSLGDAVLGGGLAGGLCALIGIAVSVALGDVAPTALVVGTMGSAVAGLIGGAVSRALPAPDL
ncbi:MAG: hypothetical protein JWN66_5040 [Sphingomonas bacterium]|jgi:hypothetical protein|uniref:hypothetical protein n=1 Tax=Sphingomonas bacterium TaxID=1895847 RepID=UPI0026212912|nr:hypothetical protein [Sphingomonas bacterium]MDB5707924.1 hypothetical protein [Sphingomonas bacterium]